MSTPLNSEKKDIFEAPFTLAGVGSIQLLKSKYGKGYFLEIKLWDDQQVEQIHQEILHLILQATRKPRFSSLLSYKVPMDKSLTKAYLQLENGFPGVDERAGELDLLSSWKSEESIMTYFCYQPCVYGKPFTLLHYKKTCSEKDVEAAICIPYRKDTTCLAVVLVVNKQADI